MATTNLAILMLSRRQQEPWLASLTPYAMPSVPAMTNEAGPVARLTAGHATRQGVTDHKYRTSAAAALRAGPVRKHIGAWIDSLNATLTQLECSSVLPFKQGHGVMHGFSKIKQLRLPELLVHCVCHRTQTWWILEGLLSKASSNALGN